MQLKNFLAAAICTADTRLRQGVLLLVLSLILPVCLTSCGWLDEDAIFEYPDETGGIDPTLVTVNLTYHCCDNIPLYKVEYVTKSHATAAHEIRRYNYEILSADTVVKKGTVERSVNDLSDITLSFSLPAGEYKTVMWQDCVDRNGQPFYDASSLGAVLIREQSSYVGCTDLKDASWNVTELSIPDTDEWYVTIDYNIDLERPLAKITFVSTDGPVFLKRCEEYLRTKSPTLTALVQDRIKLLFTYEGYVLTRFNATIGEFRNSSLGYSFEGQLEETDNPSDFLIGSDYVFVNDDEGVYWLKLTVIDNLDGGIIEQTRKIRVPVKRGHETIVTGDILTMYLGQGVHIDPEFSGEFDYIVN